MSSDPSPLGRYDRSHRDGQPHLHTVRLIGVPVRLMVAARQHHDELIRELSMLAVSGREQHLHISARLQSLIEALGRRFGSAANRPDELIDAALERGDSTVDLTYSVAAEVVEAANALEALMAEADEFCRSEQLLALPRTEPMLQFSHWYLEQFRRQVAGQPAEPWEGPLDP